MATPGQELSSIDFESMLGGPLIAVVHAQAQAAMSSVNFIKEVGFKKGPKNPDGTQGSATDVPIMVSFKYNKEISPPDLEKGTPAQYQKHTLEVPILTMLPIPFIRMKETTVDFKAKINSISYRQVDSEVKVGAELSAKAGWLWGSASLKVNTSYQKNTTEGNKVNRTYSMNVQIQAVQDEMPAGMERVLGILEDSINSFPAEPAPIEAKAKAGK